MTWNRGAERLKGYEAEQILGKHLSVFYAPEERANDTPAAELALAVKEGRSESGSSRRSATRSPMICARRSAG